MKRQKCPNCDEGLLRRRTSRVLIEDHLEEVWRECNRECGYCDKIKMRPAVMIGEPEKSFVRRCTTQRKPRTSRVTSKSKKGQ